MGRHSVSPYKTARTVTDYTASAFHPKHSQQIFSLSPMAPANCAAVLVLAIVVCAFAAAPTAAYYSGSAPPAQESCQTQIMYFANCLAHDEIREQCCTVVENKKCLCQLKREVAVPCSLHRHHERKCGPIKGPVPRTVKLEELKHLPCFQTLQC